jgi:hypothetical protein
MHGSPLHRRENVTRQAALDRTAARGKRAQREQKTDVF